jgi:putative PEP-CTERM system histidine kinase
MGAAGYYIRQFGGSFSNLFTGLFLFGALLLLAVIFASRSIRSWLKVWLYKNLFLYKYDYRQEWLQFITTITEDQSGTNLRLRVIKSIANIVDSTGGVLWEWQDGSQSYEVTEKWSYRAFPQDRALDPQLVGFMAQKGWIINLNDWRANPQAYQGLSVPDWLRDTPEIWALVPLLHRSHVLGVVLLQQPRVPRWLNWEDFDLLKTCSRQAASYLSESAALQALSAARELEIFNRRFAFVIHDIKTTINQLSLMLKNAEKHGENPAFQKDLLASVRDSVAAMSRILEQINAERKRTPAVAAVDLAVLVRHVVNQRAKGGGAAIRLDCEGGSVDVMGDEHRLTAILSHLIQNAMDAAGDQGEVAIGVHRVHDMIALDVADNGHGMDPEFVRDQLFQPFQTTKGSGYGIGAYQCRELIRELGGRLTVHSVPGEGTTMSVALPAAPAASYEPQAKRV